MKLLQYQEQVSGITSSLAPERATPDKWQPASNIPQSNWQKAALYSAAALMPFFSLNLTPTQRIEQPKVFSSQSVVLTVQRTTQYQSLAYPIAGFSPKERITVDKWYKETEKPVWLRPNDNRINGFLAFNPSPVANPFANVPSASYYGIVGTQNLQYQSLAQAPQQPAAEIVTLDKWNRDTERPTPDVKRQQYFHPSSVIDANQLASEEKVTSDRWQPNTNQPLFDIKRQQHTFPVSVVDATQLTQKERSTPDKWQPETGRPLFDVKKQQYTYQFTFFHPEPQEVSQFESPSEFARSVDRIFDVKKTQYLYPSFSIDLTQLTQAERTTPDKWVPETNKPTFDVKRQQFSYPFVFFHPEPKEVTDFESPGEFARNVDRIYDRTWNQYLYPSAFVDPFIFTQRERTTPDKWQPETNRPRFDVVRNQFLYPSFVIDTRALTASEPISVDKWVPETGRPRFDIPRQQQTYPSLFFNAFPLPNAVTIDEWFVQASEPLRKQFQAQLEQSNVLFVPENITLDKWFSSAADVYRKVQSNPIDQLSTIFVAENVTLDKWFQASEQPRFPRSTQYLYLSHQHSNNLLVIVALDKWFQPLQQPVFTRKSFAQFQNLIAQTCTGNPWFLIDRATDASFTPVSRSSDANYNQSSRSSDATYNSVNRSSDDSYNQTNRSSDEDWNKSNREC